MKYEFLEHTADVMFKAYGSNLNELFQNAALAVQETMVDLSKVEQKQIKEVFLESEELDQLLFDFLEELIYLKDAELLIFSKIEVKIKKEDKYKLVAMLSGEKIDHQKHDLRNDVKAMTYHKFEVKEINGKWQTTVIIDV